MGEYLSFVTKNGYKWYLLLQFHLQYTHYVVWLLRILQKQENALFSIKHFQYSLANFMSQNWFFCLPVIDDVFYMTSRGYIKMSTLFRRLQLLYEKEFEMSLVDSSAQFLSERWNFWQRWSSARTSLFFGKLLSK